MSRTRRTTSSPRTPVRRGLRITKVYTRTGDTGRTRLAGGQPVWKDSPRVEAYGTVDELNAVIGLIRAYLRNAPNGSPDGAPSEVSLDRELNWIQNKLFDLGALLATAPGQVFPNMPKITEQDATRLERLMDKCQVELPPLKEFILPAGGLVTSSLHIARTVCRRAERLCVHLSRKDRLDPTFIKFLNRLSDALFVLARWNAQRSGEQEVLWQRVSV